MGTKTTSRYQIHWISCDVNLTDVNYVIETNTCKKCALFLEKKIEISKDQVIRHVTQLPSTLYLGVV